MRWVTLAGVVALGACEPESGPEEVDLGSAELRTMRGCVELPAGVSAATVFDAVEEVDVVDGCFDIQIHAQRTQLVFALSAAGAPLRMGWIDPDRPNLDARLTAETLMYYAVGGPLAGADAVGPLFDLLAEAPEVDEVAEAIDAALEANPEVFGAAQTHEATGTVVASVAAKLLKPSEEEEEPGVANAVIFDPAEPQSGITMVSTSGVNSVSLQNAYRRAAHVFVQRVSTFDQDDNETANAADISDAKVASVQALQSWVDGFDQIVQASYSPGGLEGSENVAYVPRTAGPYKLEPVPGAKKTRFHLTTVGPGLQQGGAYGDLTSKQRDQLLATSTEFLLIDLVLPVIAHIVVPNMKWDDLSSNDLVPGLAKDLAKILGVHLPRAGQLMADGDARGALGAVWEALAGSNTFRDAIFEAVYEKLYDFRTAGSTAGTQRAGALATRFAKATGAVDALLAGSDIAAVGAALLVSNRADRWTVDVTESTVRIEPREPKATPDTRVRLTVNVLDAGDDVAFEYRFSTGGVFGSLDTGIEQGISVTTSQNWVDYVAGSEEGSDEVTVQVYEIRLSDRVSVGSRSVTVKVEDVCDPTIKQRATFTWIEDTFTCFEDDLCSKGWPVWSFRAVKGAYNYVAEINTHGESIGEWKTGTRTLVLWSNQGQPYRYYYTKLLAGNHLESMLALRGPMDDTELLHVTSELFQVGTHIEGNMEIFRRQADRWRDVHAASEMELTPVCLGSG